MSDTPLAGHALLSDCRSVALVTADGSVDWLCWPRMDSSSVFGRLLDPAAGHFQISPEEDGFVATWRYREPGLVLETCWSGPGGELEVTDALALGARERGHDLGRTSPGVLLRRVRCTTGQVRVAIHFAPRPEYGLVHPVLSTQRGSVVADGGSSVLRLDTDARLSVAGSVASATILLEQGQELTFALRQSDAWAPHPERWSPHQVRRRLTDTEAAWRSWSALHQRYTGPYQDLVRRSGVVLQGLTYAGSGAIAAAATTSLPEGVGSGRTWDYRFTWIRDASLTLQGLYVAACPEEAGRFFAFVARSAATQLDRGAPLQIMFGIGGERDLSERTLPQLSGWRDSGPVRVGNEAWRQLQVDVYGAFLDAAWTFREQLHTVDDRTRSFVVAAVDAAARVWRDDDQGIWEFRGPPRPFLHSKLMCWVALDRGVRLVECGLLQSPHVHRWAEVRDTIRSTIEREGWNDRVGAFTQFFGSDELDASVLTLASSASCRPATGGSSPPSTGSRPH
jgi:GH15 family glucan-1,4-alpha-glucosidase